MVPILVQIRARSAHFGTNARATPLGGPLLSPHSVAPKRELHHRHLGASPKLKRCMHVRARAECVPATRFAMATAAQRMGIRAIRRHATHGRRGGGSPCARPSAPLSPRALHGDRWRRSLAPTPRRPRPGGVAASAHRRIESVRRTCSRRSPSVSSRALATGWSSNSDPSAPVRESEIASDSLSADLKPLPGDRPDRPPWKTPGADPPALPKSSRTSVPTTRALGGVR